MMKLYHGTNTAYTAEILRNGLSPRQGRKTKGNWSHTVISRSDAVYLTTAYAPYFAIASCNNDADCVPAVVEIETDRLDEYVLVPDEDTLEQLERNNHIDDLPRDWSMEQRTRYYRDRLHLYRGEHQWRGSIRAMGTCCYLDVVPTSAITRVAIFDPKLCPQFSFQSMDPTITVMNYQIVGKKYRALTKWLFGDPLEGDEPQRLLSDKDLEITKGLFDAMKWEFPLPPEKERVGVEILKV